MAAPQALSRLSPWLVLFVLAWWVGSMQMIHPVGWGFGQGFEMSAIARSLAAHGAFADPFAPFVTGPTAVVPPLHPFVMGVVYRLFPGPAAGVVLTVANIVANALIAALLPWLAMVLCGRRGPGVFAGLLWLPAMRLMPQWDASFTLAALVLFAVLTAGRAMSWRWALAAGVAGGVVTLGNPATVIIAGLWMVYLVVGRVSWGGAARLLAVFGVAVALVNVPWAVRNYGIWHAFALRTNFGMTLYSSNNDCAQSSLQRDARSGCYDATHPVASASEIADLRRMGEVAFDKDRTARGVAWIRSNPRRFAELTLARVVEFWFPEPGRPAYTFYAIWVITLLSVPGVVLMARDGVRAVWVLGTIWAVYPLMYYIVVSSDRYRYPVIWTSLLPAGYFLWVVWAWVSRSGAERQA